MIGLEPSVAQSVNYCHSSVYEGHKMKILKFNPPDGKIIDVFDGTTKVLPSENKPILSEVELSAPKQDSVKSAKDGSALIDAEQASNSSVSEHY